MECSGLFSHEPPWIEKLFLFILLCFQLKCNWLQGVTVFNNPWWLFYESATCFINTSDFAELFTCVFSLQNKSSLRMTRSPPAADSYQQDSIRMTLENADLWKSFHTFGTEMIITKHGRYQSCPTNSTSLLSANSDRVIYHLVCNTLSYAKRCCAKRAKELHIFLHNSCVLLQEDVSPLQHQSIWAPTFR